MLARNESALREAYGEVLRVARRCTRSADEARDLAQEVLLVALERGVEDWQSSTRRAWLRGVAWKRAAFRVRSELRRRRREQGVDVAEPGDGAWVWRPALLASLPRSLRAVAALASAELCAAEIRWVLGISDTALRQRLSALRRVVRAQAEPPTMASTAPRFSFGPVRAEVLARLRRQPGALLATHDPDGHQILLCRAAHKTRPPGNS